MNTYCPTILLINPKGINTNIAYLPLGLAYIAAFLKDFNVSVIDANVEQIEDNKLIEMISQKKPDIVGIAATTPEIKYVWKISKMCKKILPNSTIVLGGAHPTTLPIESIKKPFVDIVVVGEGEYTMKEIAKGTKLKNIKGIVYKKNGKIITTPPAKISNLDKLPFPARHLFPHQYKPQSYQKLPAAQIFTSRGCPHRCTFCSRSVFGRNLRVRNPKNVVDEIELLKNSGIKEFHIIDDNFNADKKRAIEICNLLIKRKINLPWSCAQGLRINNLDDKFLKLMKKAGCYKICIGIESGNQQILNNIQKDITLDMVEHAVTMTNKAKLFVGGLFMIGNYGESEDTIKETINFAKKLKLDYAVFSVATPYPGTIFYKQVIEEGKMLAKSWNDFNRYTGAIFEWKSLSKQQIDNLYKKAYISFYIRPTYILRRLLKFRIRDLKLIIEGVRIISNILRFQDAIK